MFRAIGRFLRAMMYTFVGDINKWSEVWESKPAFIQAEYDNIIRDHKSSISEVENALAGIMALAFEKEERAKKLAADIDKYQKMKRGAAAKAKKVVKQLQDEGKSQEEVKTNLEYVKCSDAHSDFTSTLASKEEEVAEIEKELERYEKQLQKHKASLQRMVRELKNIKSEKHETVADMVIAQQEQRVNKLLAGISDSKTGEARERMQELRRKAKAKAEISSELAGTDAQVEEDEFLEYARTSEASSEFDDMFFESPETESSSSEAGSKTQIPEN